MKLRHLGLAIAAAAAAASVSRANVVLSEVLYNEVGSNTAGEFIEIYNNGSSAVDLSNYKVGDEEANNTAEATPESGGMLQFPAGTSINPGQNYVIAAGATAFETNYGFKPDFEASNTDATVKQLTSYTFWDKDGGPFNMSNTNDQALILDGSDNIVDDISWGNTFAFNPALPATAADGQSYFRVDPTTDTDTAADWQLTTAAPAGAAWTTKSTPGIVTLPSATPEPAALGILGLAFTTVLRRRAR